MFRFRNKVYASTLDGELYQLISESLNSKWTYRRVKEIYKKDISNMVLEDVYVCQDGSISLKTDGKIYTYLTGNRTGNKTNNGWFEEIGPRKIVYGETSKTRIILYIDRLEFNFEVPGEHTTMNTGIISKISPRTNSRRQISPRSTKSKMTNSPNKKNINIVFTLTGSYRDVELNTDEDGIIVLVAKTGHVKEYKPVVWLPLTSESQNHFRERFLYGTGDRLIRTNNLIWLLTGAKCSSI